MEKVNIFDAIESNKRNSVLLVLFMSGIVLASVSALTYVIGLGDFGFMISVMLVIIYVVFAYGAGASTILSISGARQLKENEEPFLQNVVEGLAIAAGIQKPLIWIIEDEGMNAFATGMDPKNSHVVFTRGLLRNLKREELEGVAAHEISHIANYDIRFATLAVIMVGVIAIISDVVLRYVWHGGNRDRKGTHPYLLIFAIIFAILAPIFGHLVKFAISREREYLADANGAKLTRYPEGLATALEKLKGHSKVATAKQETASLFISDPFEKKLIGFFATHPPMDERIKRLRAM